MKGLYNKDKKDKPCTNKLFLHSPLLFQNSLKILKFEIHKKFKIKNEF